MRFQRAVQLYLWALPSLNMYGMKEGSEAKFGKGYNVLPIFKDRLDAKTLITTPNSDVIYALGYLDLKEDGPGDRSAPRITGHHRLHVPANPPVKDFWSITARELQTCPPSARVGAKLAATPRFRTRHCTNTERNIVPASDEAGKLTGGESRANSDT